MGDRKISICKSGEYPAFVELLYEVLQQYTYVFLCWSLNSYAMIVKVLQVAKMLSVTFCRCYCPTNCNSMTYFQQWIMKIIFEVLCIPVK